LNIKIAGKWMFIPLKMVLIGIDPYPNNEVVEAPFGLRLHGGPTANGRQCVQDWVDVASRTIWRFAPSNNLPGPLGDRLMGLGLTNGLQFFLKRIFVEGLQGDIKTSSSNSNSFHA